jgi:hypothetical protein
MVQYQETLWCDGCGSEIRWKPVLKDQRHYCCINCLQGEQCSCDDSLEDHPLDGKLSSQLISRMALIYSG